MNQHEIAKAAVLALDSKKARDMAVLDVSALTTLADYFVIATGASATQIRSLSDEVGRKLGELGNPPLRSEGTPAAGWMLLDFGSVVVHIFARETREFYSLERLWSDAAVVDTAAWTEGKSEV